MFKYLKGLNPSNIHYIYTNRYLDIYGAFSFAQLHKGGGSQLLGCGPVAGHPPQPCRARTASGFVRFRFRINRF